MQVQGYIKVPSESPLCGFSMGCQRAPWLISRLGLLFVVIFYASQVCTISAESPDVLPQGVSADTRANNFLHALPTAVNGTEVRVHMHGVHHSVLQAS
jgi:hypothetical protein